MRTPIFLIASLVTTTAYAEQVGVVVTGEPTVQPQIAAHLERWLHEKGRTVVAGPLEPDAINTLIDCFVLEDLVCARGVVDVRAKSNAVIFTRAEATANADGTRDIAITGYWFQKDRQPIAERRVCKACNDRGLFATVDELMHAFVHDPPLPVDSEPISVESEHGVMRRWLPHGLVVAGVGGLVGGGILIALDEDPDPTGVQKPRIRSTATGGALLGLAGAAAIGTGIYLWYRDRQSAPIAALSSDGGYVGWAGRF